MFLLTRELFGSRAGFFATAIMNLTVFYGLMSGNWILPDGPLNFFLLATALVLVPVAKGEELEIRAWLLAGLLIGLAALSKYHAFLFIAGFFCFLLSSQEHRQRLIGSGPWIACVFAILVFLPVILWNAANGWVSILFQGGRAALHHIALGKFASLALQQAIVLLPGALLPMTFGIWNALHAPDGREKFLLWLGLPIALLLTLLPLVTAQGMLHWAMPGWLLLLPLAGKQLAKEPVSSRRFLMSTAALFVTLTALGVLEFQTGWLGWQFPKLFKRGDPTEEYVSWSKLATSIPTDKPNGFVITTNWRDASRIDQGLDGKYRVLVSSNDPRNFAVALDRNVFSGRFGWIVVRSDTPRLQVDRLKSCFGTLEQPLRVNIKQHTSAPLPLAVIGGNNFKPYNCELPSFDH